MHSLGADGAASREVDTATQWDWAARNEVTDVGELVLFGSKSNSVPMRLAMVCQKL